MVDLGDCWRCYLKFERFCDDIQGVLIYSARVSNGSTVFALYLRYMQVGGSGEVALEEITLPL